MDARTILEKLGGPPTVAAATGRPRNSVTYWGRRNCIPSRHWPALLKLAVDRGQSDVTLESLYEHQMLSRQSAPLNEAA